MKKIKLMLVALVAMIGVNAFAADPVTITVKVAGTNGVVYAPVVSGSAPLKYTITEAKATAATSGTFVSGTVSVMENGAEMKGVESITIPDEVEISITSDALAAGTVTAKFKVTSIVNGDGTSNAFTATNSNKLATLTIGANVETIGKNAFNGVTTLTTVTLGAAVKTIGESAFQQTAISALTLPASLETIGNKAFFGNGTNYPTFSTIAIPAKVTAIGESAFEGCENLSTVTLAANSWLNTIGIGAFAYTSLTELDLSNATAYDNDTKDETPAQGMTKFGTEDASYGPFTSETHKATSLITKVVLPTTVTTIEKSAFKGVQYLAEIDLKNVGTIAQDAFNGCKNLTEVAIGTAKTADTFTGIAIAKDAFSGCAKLATVELGKIKSGLIAEDAFGSSTNVAGVTAIEFNAIEDIISNAFNIATVTTLTFNNYIAGAFIPEGAFTKAFGGNTPDEDEVYTITYIPTLPATSPVKTPFDFKAFASAWTADPVITLNTVSDIQAAYGKDLLKVSVVGGYTTAFTIGAGKEGSKKLVKDKNSSNYYYYYAGTGTPTIIAKEQESGANVTVYQAYTDGDGDEVDIYFVPLKVVDGKYIVEESAVVITKSNQEDAVEAAPGVSGQSTMVYYKAAGGSSYSALNDLKLNATAKSKLAVLSDPELLANGDKEVWFFNNPASSGFGFTKYDASKQNGLGANAVYFQTEPSAAARLNIIWLDEEGNTTAIQKIENAAAADNGAIYNLRGEKVTASYKGLVIKNGKKYIQK